MKKTADKLQPHVRFYVNAGEITENAALQLDPKEVARLSSDVLLDLYKDKKLSFSQILALDFDQAYNLNYFPEVRARFEQGKLPFELLHCPGAQFYIEKNCLTLEQLNSMNFHVKSKLNSVLLRKLFEAGKLNFAELLALNPSHLENDEETRRKFSSGELPLEFLLLDCPGLQFYIDHHCVTLDDYKDAAAAIKLANQQGNKYISLEANLNSKILQMLFLEKKLTFDQIMYLDSDQRDITELTEKARMRFEAGESCFEQYFIYPDEIDYMQHAVSLANCGHYHTLTPAQQQTLDSQLVRKCYENGFYTFDEIFNYVLNHTHSKIELSYKDFKKLNITDASPLLHREINEAISIRRIAKLLFLPTPSGQPTSWLPRLPENVKITLAGMSANPELCNVKTAEKIAVKVAGLRC